MERWKDIPGFEQYYQVSNFGRVKSLDRVDSLGRHRKGQILSDCNNGTGYRVVNLKVNGSQNMRTVHFLVMLAFRDPREIGLEICHNDGDKSNNRLSNLRYDTRKSNHADKHKHGTALCGDTHYWAVLSEDDVHQIKNLLNRGDKQREIARKFKVHFATISAISCGKSWAHVV
jgi:hypothetical protein